MRIVMVLLTILTLVTTYFFFSKDDLSETITSTIPKSKESIETRDYREALLISNNDYKYLSNLKDISSNITTLEKTLENLNFNVQIQNNLNSKELKQAIYQFKERLALKKNTIGFLYYAGHGCQLNNVGYLVPTNVDIKKKIDIEYDAMNIDKMLKILDSAGNKINMLFLDACRNIPTGVRGEGVRGLAQAPKTPKGTLLVYATEAGKTADDNTKFINSLINNIKQPNQHIRSMAFKVSDEIATQTKGHQIPEIFAKWVPKTILNKTIDLPNTKKEETIIAPKTEKESVKLTAIPSVIEKKYSLTIETNPIDATVRILNIKPKYTDGILLNEGSYQIEVSKENYITKTLNLSVQEDMIKSIKLTQKSFIPEPIITNVGVHPTYLGGKHLEKRNSYYIKVGTYRDVTSVVHKIKNNNFNYSLVKVENDKTLISVYIGPFFDRGQAGSQLPKVKSNILAGAYITKKAK